MKEENIQQIILQELQQQTKLLEYQTKLFEDFIMRGVDDGSNRATKREEVKQQLYATISTMFKGTPMEAKMQDAMKNVMQNL